MKRILVVDDDPEILGAIKSSLERQKSIEVTVAQDGKDALEKIGPNDFDLIVLDIMMPNISGDELLKLIRQNFKTINTPVVISTAKYETESLIKFMNLGATDYLIKPYDVKELTKMIAIYA